MAKHFLSPVYENYAKKKFSGKPFIVSILQKLFSNYADLTVRMQNKFIIPNN